MGYVGTSFNNNKHAIHQILPIIEGMLDTDITSLYNGDPNRNFYVYAHMDPTKILNVKNIKHFVLASRYGLREVPFYIGKGTGNRWLDFGRNDSHRKKRGALIKNGLDIKPVKLAENLTEAESFSLEAKLVDILGLISLNPSSGMLVNLDEGFSPKERRKLYPEEAKQILKGNGYAV